MLLQVLDVDTVEQIPDWENFPEDDEPLMPAVSRRGRKRRTDLREVINVLRYLVRSGCGWEMLPVHFGP